MALRIQLLKRSLLRNLRIGSGGNSLLPRRSKRQAQVPGLAERPDFRLAAIEFLIGLLCSFAPPADEETWEDLWNHPPGPEVLDVAFRPGAHAFSLDGDGPRFMQDFDALDGGAESPVGTLLIEAPGAQTERNNADLLIKRDRVRRLSRGFYPPANLNRDDTGRPKTAQVDGVPRLRISS